MSFDFLAGPWLIYWGFTPNHVARRWLRLKSVYSFLLVWKYHRFMISLSLFPWLSLCPSDSKTLKVFKGTNSVKTFTLQKSYFHFLSTLHPYFIRIQINENLFYCLLASCWFYTLRLSKSLLCRVRPLLAQWKYFLWVLQFLDVIPLYS